MHSDDHSGTADGSKSKPRNPPAQIKLLGDDGRSKININIGRITKSVSIGNTNYVTNYRPARQRSDSSSSSSSDSDDERFFRSRGLPVPSKNPIRQIENAARLMETQFSQPVHTCYVGRKGTQALDSKGQPVTVNVRQLSAGKPGTSVHVGNPQHQLTKGTVITTQQQNNSHVLSEWPRGPDSAPVMGEWTKYEQQTQMCFNFLSRIPDPSRTVNETMVFRIASHFGRGWRRVFRHLGFLDAVIDMTHENSGQMLETVQTLLINWTRGEDRPDVQTLVEALVRSEQTHIIDYLK